jgi:hypothetical protein
MVRSTLLSATSCAALLALTGGLAGAVLLFALLAVLLILAAVVFLAAPVRLGLAPGEPCFVRERAGFARGFLSFQFAV